MTRLLSLSMEQPSDVWPPRDMEPDHTYAASMDYAAASGYDQPPQAEYDQPPQAEYAGATEAYDEHPQVEYAEATEAIDGAPAYEEADHTYAAAYAAEGTSENIAPEAVDAYSTELPAASAIEPEGGMEPDVPSALAVIEATVQGESGVAPDAPSAFAVIEATVQGALCNGRDSTPGDGCRPTPLMPPAGVEPLQEGGPMVKKGVWKPEEDEKLRALVSGAAKVSWEQVAMQIEGRTEKQCREHWLKVRLAPASLRPARTRNGSGLTRVGAYGRPGA